MKYTTNYHLPQWAKEDRIMMEDFNQMCADMEAGLSSNRETARQEAEEAAKPPYVAGSYYGAGQTQSIELGFRPSFLIISGASSQAALSRDHIVANIAMTGGRRLQDCVTLTDTGFTIKLPSGDTPRPNLVNPDIVYDYIAFR